MAARQLSVGGTHLPQLRAGVGLRAMTLSGFEVDDGVDPVRRDPQCDGEIDVAAAVGIDEGVDPVSVSVTATIR
jgi:hypothetical protein